MKGYRDIRRDGGSQIVAQVVAARQSMVRALAGGAPPRRRRLRKGRGGEEHRDAGPRPRDACRGAPRRHPRLRPQRPHPGADGRGARPAVGAGRGRSRAAAHRRRPRRAVDGQRARPRDGAALRRGVAGRRAGLARHARADGARPAARRRALGRARRAAARPAAGRGAHLQVAQLLGPRARSSSPCPSAVAREVVARSLDALYRPPRRVPARPAASSATSRTWRATGAATAAPCGRCSPPTGRAASVVARLAQVPLLAAIPRPELAAACDRGAARPSTPYRRGVRAAARTLLATLESPS